LHFSNCAVNFGAVTVVVPLTKIGTVSSSEIGKALNMLKQ